MLNVKRVPTCFIDLSWVDNICLTLFVFWNWKFFLFQRVFCFIIHFIIWTIVKMLHNRSYLTFPYPCMYVQLQFKFRCGRTRSRRLVESKLNHLICLLCAKPGRPFPSVLPLFRFAFVVLFRPTTARSQLAGSRADKLWALSFSIVG